MHHVRLPTYINVSKKTTKALNLNVYRNLHHHHLNKQKQNFHDEVKPLLGGIPRAEKIWIHYRIFAPRNGRLDTMNVGSIVDKYFSDTLVEAKKIIDDHFDHVVLISFSFGGVRPMDGHAIAHIHILEEEQPMRILLDQDDIQTALENHVETLGISGANGVVLSVEDGEVVAEVTMGEDKPAPKKTTRKPATRRTVKTPAKAKESANVEDTAETGGNGGDSGDGGSTEADTPAGDEAPAKTTETKAKTEQGNLFGDSDSQSSDTTEEADQAESPKGDPSAKVTKKSSIFDVD